MSHADLQITHLLRPAWETFKRRPGIAIAMWIVCVFFETGGGVDTEDASAFESLIAIAILLASGPMQGGYDLAMLRLQRGDETVTFVDLFAGFRKFEHLFLVFLVMMIGVIVGTLLLIIPGIIVALVFWPAFLLVMEDDLSAIDALRASWDLTNGYKLPLFFLGVVSMALLIAGVLAFGFGILVAGPVVQLAWLAAYEEIRAVNSSDAEAQAYPQA